MVSVGTSSPTELISEGDAEIYAENAKLNVYVDVAGADIRLIEGDRQEILQARNPQGVPLNAGDTLPIDPVENSVWAIGDGGTATVEVITTELRLGEIAR